MAAGFKASQMGQTVLLFSVIFAFTDAANILDVLASSLRDIFTKQNEPQYTLIKKETDYEERMYNSTTWVCTNGTGIGISFLLLQESFLKLFSYIAGKNADDVKIDMAVPVSIEYFHEIDQDPPLLSACFYLGGPYQTEDPPAPNDESLSIVKREPMTIFTKKIGGFLTKPKEWLKEAMSLNETVTNNGEKARRDLMFWNAFDSPLIFRNRRNEIWLLKENEQQ